MATSNWSSAASTGTCVSAAARERTRRSTRGTPRTKSTPRRPSRRLERLPSPSRSLNEILLPVSTRRRGRTAGVLQVSPQVPARTHTLPFPILHPSAPDRISHAPLRVTDQGDANQNSSPTPPSTTVLAHLKTRSSRGRGDPVNVDLLRGLLMGNCFTN